MTTSQFNIQKEIHENALNKIIQSVKFNKFPEYAKTQVVELGVHAIETINALQNEVAEQIETQSYKAELYNHEEKHNEKKAIILQEKQPIHKMRIGFVSELNEIIDKTEKTNYDIITGPEFKRFDKTPAFKENEKLLVELLKDLTKAVMLEDEPKKEEEKPKEKGFFEKILG